jgi:hypothetical protein
MKGRTNPATPALTVCVSIASWTYPIKVAAPVSQLRDQSVQVLRGCRTAHDGGVKSRLIFNT